MFITVYALGKIIKANSIASRIVNYIGSCTFAIYLFHMLVIGATRTWQRELISKFDSARTFFDAAAYYISFALAVFGVALVVAIIFKYIVEKPVARAFKK
jgi:peptidoglycan/LPS O-acetylase OafA/YrhL